MLGRHNIVLYSDELERAIGGIKIMLDQKEDVLSPAHTAFWLGVVAALQQIRHGDLEVSWEQFVATMELHFGGDDE